jgi:CheY-like chemotaxis protein
LISHKFVQLMGGDMHVTSTVGLGTTFSFDIQVEVTAVADLTAEQPTNRAIALQPGQQRLRMLIVDDKQDNRQLLFELLNPFGFDLLEAENGQEAVDIVERWKPHLIWMDMRMPVMDGYEATEKIRELKTSLPYPVVIAVTASVFEENRAAVMAIGCDDIVVKPFQEEDIVAMLQKHLDVKFLYASEEMSTTISSLDKVKPSLKTEDFNTLSQEILTQLKASVATLEMDTVLAVIEDIREQNQPLAEALKQLVEGYRFDKLQKLLEGIQQK